MKRPEMNEREKAIFIYGAAYGMAMMIKQDGNFKGWPLEDVVELILAY